MPLEKRKTNFTNFGISFAFIFRLSKRKIVHDAKILHLSNVVFDRE